MDLPSGPLVKFLKRFSTRKKLRIKFLMMDLPSGMKILKPHQVFDGFTFWTFSQIFEGIFYEKKVVHQVFDDGFTFWNENIETPSSF